MKRILTIDEKALINTSLGFVNESILVTQDKQEMADRLITILRKYEVSYELT